MYESAYFGLLSFPILFLIIRYFSLKKTNQVQQIPAIVNNVKPVDGKFDWQSAIPLKIRPFVGKKDFKPNMGIYNLQKTPEEWLLIENSYKETTAKKRIITEEKLAQTIQVHDNYQSIKAAREYYDTVMTFFLQRYPQYFIKKGCQIYNKINDDYLPADLSSMEPIKLFQLLARNMEEDVVIFLKDDPKNEEEEYTLRAAITGFASGFDPSLSHNKVISQIHDVVPQYKSRLKMSMGRFFNRLEPSDLWLRFNWSIQTHDQHFTIDLNHGREGDMMKKLSVADIDFENGCFLRCERQILTRMPKLRANIMTVRTYLTPMSKVKEEGLADELCRAIDALPEDLAHYKKRGAWGDAVKEYLKS